MKRLLTPEEVEDILSVIQPVYTGITNVEKEQAVLNARQTVRAQLVKARIHPEMIGKLKETIEKYYYRSLLAPGEMVGVIAATSLGEKNTQASLNSVAGDTKLLLNIEGSTRVVTIEELYDEYYDTNPVERQTYTGMNTRGATECYADVVMVDNIQVPSVNSQGRVSWCDVTQLIRHPLYTNVIKVTTMSGRSIVATDGLSFLKYDTTSRQIVPVCGSELKVGDKLPVTFRCPAPERLKTSVNMREWLSPREYLYGRDIHKALEIKKLYDEGYLEKRRRSKEEIQTCTTPYACWYNDHNGKDFTLPFSRGSLLLRLLNEGTKGADFYRDDCVFMFPQGVSNAQVREVVPLDDLTGFFIGAYLADGCHSKNYVTVTKHCQPILDKIKAFCDRWNIGTHYVYEGYKYKFVNKYEKAHGRTVTEESRVKEESTDACEIRVHSKLIADWIEACCGAGSLDKHLPDFAFDANDTFVRGLLDGLFSGDGSVDSHIQYSSISRDLINGICTILARYGIAGGYKKYQQTQNNKNSVVIHPIYNLTIKGANITRFCETVGRLTEPNKNARLTVLSTKEFAYEVYQPQGMREADLVVEDFDVFLDPIVSIEKATDLGFVYDLTVLETVNFSLLGGLQCHDSFHSRCGAKPPNFFH